MIITKRTGSLGWLPTKDDSRGSGIADFYRISLQRRIGSQTPRSAESKGARVASSSTMDTHGLIQTH
eukprot:6812374-Pyramimonas_sp.AAC.1